MAEVHDGLAGRGQVLPGQFVKPPVLLHNQPGVAQHGEVLERVVVAGARDFGHLINRPRFARAQILEHLPALRVADGFDHPLQVRQRRSHGSFRRFRG